MSIEAFYPESERFGRSNKRGLEDKMIKKDVISNADVKNYANYIIGKLKKIKSSNQDGQRSFVLDALNRERLFVNFYFHNGADSLKDIDNLDKQALDSAFLRIRRALKEELKGKIDGKIYLVIDDVIKDMEESEDSVDYISSTDPLVEEIEIPVAPNPRRRNIISVVENIDNSVESVYKDQQWKVPREQENAFSLYAQMAPHPNMAKIKEYDPENNTVIYEKINFKNFQDYGRKNDLSFYRNPKELANLLKVLDDCVEAALYLENNHLVLQDIKLSNIGIESDDKGVKGVLFDLEGLVEEGVTLKSRMHTPGYLPPETKLDNAEVTNLTTVGPKEMVFQLGVCLQKITDYCLSVNAREMLVLNKSFEARRKLGVIGDLDELVIKMKEVDPEHRKDLRYVHDKLASIIENIKKIIK